MAASSARDTTMFQIPLPVAQLVLSAINHITGQQPWLRELLASHAGHVVRIRALPPNAGGQGGKAAPRPAKAGTAPRSAAAPRVSAEPASDEGFLRLPTLQADARIGVDGMLTAVSGEEPAVVLTARPTVDALFRVLREGPLALGATLRIEGDVMLAQALGDVAKALHWDVEEDLSQVVGDVAAHRAGQFWRDARVHAAEVGSRLQDALADHLASGTGVLVSRPEFEEWSDGVRSLAQRLDRLEGARGR